MNPIWGYVVGIATAILMVVFLGIWSWAWLPQHQSSFEALAKLPMEDEDDRESER